MKGRKTRGDNRNGKIRTGSTGKRKLKVGKESKKMKSDEKIKIIKKEKKAKGEKK